MKNHFKQITLTLLATALLATACNKVPSPLKNAVDTVYNYSHQLQIKNIILNVEVVSDENKMQTGLSRRKSLGQNQGMLFNFQKKSQPNFWMKDMLINLDLIWIVDKKIIGITPDVPAPVGNLKLEITCPPSALTKGKCGWDNLPTYAPPSPVDQVLEVNAGWSETNDIKIGDEVKLINIK